MNIPVDGEHADKKAELERLSNMVEVKESSFEEFSRIYEQFQQRYLFEVGQKRAELNRLIDEFNTLSAKKFQYGYKVNQKGFESEMGVKKPAVEWKDEKNKTRIESHTIQELKDAKRLYRKIASLIHPDKATDDMSHPFRTKLMSELNDAYDLKDMIKMQRILEQWQESPESIAGDDTVSEHLRIDRAIGQFKRRLLEIEKETSRIKTSELYALMLKVHEAERKGRDLLVEMSMSLNTQIQDAKNNLLIRMYG